MLTAGAATLARGLGGPARAQVQASVIRYDATSTGGKAMLRIYADAVRAMMAKDPGDPLSWTFQWFIHAIPDNTTKAAELDRVFPHPSAARTLAEATWSTCEPHFSGEEDNFLPWHRMYTAHFEAIVRAVTNRPDFTLPYWNYTGASPARALPPEFLKPGDPVWGSLYRPDRGSDAKAGRPVDTNGPDPITLNAMKSITYSGGRGDAGFCANLDGDPHGSIHDDVGNDVGMGAVPWAANDPIFWLHHCNIDRIWASWNKVGGKNLADPGFLAQSFPLVGPDGLRSDTKVRAVMDTSQLHYLYDRYLLRPPGSRPFPPAPQPARLNALPRVMLAPPPAPGAGAPSEPIRLGAQPVTVTLPGPPVAVLAPPPPRVQSPGAGAPGAQSPRPLLRSGPPPAPRTVHLRLIGLQSDAPVGGGYDVYLNLPAGQAPTRQSPAYVGTVSFFGTSQHHDQQAMAGMSMPMGRTVSFELSPEAGRAAEASSERNITFAPTRAVNTASAPPARPRAHRRRP